MHPSLEQLLKVQQVDSDIRLLRQAARLRPEELEDDRKKVAACAESVNGVLAEIKRLRVDVDTGELEVKEHDGEIVKLNIALNSAKTNQEYAVLREQIQRKEDARGKTEEVVLERLGQIDQLEARRRELESELTEYERILAKREAEVQEIVKGLEEQIKGREAERKELVQDIDPQHLALYERILHRHGNQAICPVRDAICQGCFMMITPQNVSLLMLGREIIQCRNCSRLLYVE